MQRKAESTRRPNPYPSDVLPGSEVHLERRLVPQRVDRVVQPPAALGAQLHVEVPDHPGEHHSHLGVGEAVSCQGQLRSSMLTKQRRVSVGVRRKGRDGRDAHFMPRQFLGPK